MDRSIRSWAAWAAVAIVLHLGVAPASAYVIDASLSDWGVTPFVDWVPGGTADFIVADGQNTYHAQGYEDELYDFEAMYFDDDAEALYFAIVSSYPLGPPGQGGDLGLDLNGDVAISEHGVVTGLEYAVRVSTSPAGQVIAAPVWADSGVKEWADGWQGSPWQVLKGATIGTAAIAFRRSNLEDGTSIVEISVPRDAFPMQLLPDSRVTAHITMWCGNDSLNLTGTVNVPEPATLLLCLVGAGLLRRQRCQ